jgi:periplasmic protein TonB
MLHESILVLKGGNEPLGAGTVCLPVKERPMRDVAHSMNLSGRAASAALSVAMSGVIFGLLATLGWQNASGPSGPALTVLSTSEFAADESAAPEPEELRAEPARSADAAQVTLPEQTPRQETPTTSAPAPGPASDKPVVNLASSSPLPSEAAGAEGTAGRGQQAGAAATPSAASGSAQAQSAAAGGSGDAYGRAVFARIKARQSYVNELSREGTEGSVTLAFLVDPRGRMRDERVAASSGSQRLDQIALGQLRSAAPFPAPPQHKARPFTIRLTYRQKRPD